MAEKIIQDSKFLNQIFSNLSSHNAGGMSVAVIGELAIYNGGKQGDLYSILENLPEPRLESLKDLAIQVVRSRIPVVTEAAKFLGVSYRTITGRTAKADTYQDESNVIPLQIEGVKR